MKWIFMLCFAATLQASELSRPKSISAVDLNEFANLSEKRQGLIQSALAHVTASGWLRYKFGSADPGNGGFDCSGAMYFVLRSNGLKPPRTSANQYGWVSKLTEIPAAVESLDDPKFKDLTPGDLVFWSGTYVPTDGRKINITHVGMYLGTEKKDGHPVMICSTSGRSYRGTQCDGYGVYDFRIPRKTSKSRLVGFGPPPGL